MASILNKEILNRAQGIVFSQKSKEIMDEVEIMQEVMTDLIKEKLDYTWYKVTNNFGKLKVETAYYVKESQSDWTYITLENCINSLKSLDAKMDSLKKQFEITKD